MQASGNHAGVSLALHPRHADIHSGVFRVWATDGTVTKEHVDRTKGCSQVLIWDRAYPSGHLTLSLVLDLLRPD
jgi:hypothetical protein